MTDETEEGTMRYEIIRPSDGEVLHTVDYAPDAESVAIDYATVDEESIVVVRTELGQRTIIAVAHPSGRLYDTTGRGGKRTATRKP